MSQTDNTPKVLNVVNGENVEPQQEPTKPNYWTLRLNYGGKRPQSLVFNYSDQQSPVAIADRLNRWIQLRVELANEVREDSEGKPLVKMVNRKNKKTGEITEHETVCKAHKLGALGITKRTATLDIVCNNEVMRSDMYGIPVTPLHVFENGGKMLKNIVQKTINYGKAQLIEGNEAFYFVGIEK